MTVAHFRRQDRPPHMVEVHALSLLSNVNGDTGDVGEWWWACFCRAGGSEPSERRAKSAWEAHHAQS